MPGKILDENDKVIFEFEEGQPVAILLAAFIQKAKFGEKFENNILFNPWINNLLKASLGKHVNKYEFATNSSLGSDAPKYFLDDGMTEPDWAFRDFYHEFTMHLQNSTDELQSRDWPNLTRDQRAEFIRLGLYPHAISDVRLNDMIEDIDNALRSSAEVYNSDYTHDR